MSGPKEDCISTSQGGPDQSCPDQEDEWVAVGQLKAPFGVKGWLRVFSYTEPYERILTFPHWWLGDERQAYQRDESQRDGGGGYKQVTPLSGQRHKRGVIVQLQGVDNPDIACLYTGFTVWIPRGYLDEPEEGVHYWTDLVGVQVVTSEGEALGIVESLFATGANDVLVVREPDGGERLLPFTQDVVLSVDISTQTITVSLLPGM